MKKTMLASLILSQGITALPAQAKGNSGYISRAKAVAIAKARVGGGKVDNVDFERSRRHGAYYEPQRRLRSARERPNRQSDFRAAR